MSETERPMKWRELRGVGELTLPGRMRTHVALAWRKQGYGRHVSLLLALHFSLSAASSLPACLPAAPRGAFSPTAPHMEPFRASHEELSTSVYTSSARSVRLHDRHRHRCARCSACPSWTERRGENKIPEQEFGSHFHTREGSKRIGGSLLLPPIAAATTTTLSQSCHLFLPYCSLILSLSPSLCLTPAPWTQTRRITINICASHFMSGAERL